MTATIVEPTIELDESIFDEEPQCSWDDPECDHVADWSVIFWCDCASLLCDCHLDFFQEVTRHPVPSNHPYTCDVCHSTINMVAGVDFYSQCIKDVLPL